MSFLIADLSGRALVRLSRTDAPGPRRAGGGEDVDADPAAERGSWRDGQERAVSEPLQRGETSERALRTQSVQIAPAGTATSADPSGVDGWTVLAPVTERGEALGLLELVLPVRPTDAQVAEIARTAHLLGFVVVAARRHTDLYEWAQRSTPTPCSQ
ncbi:hypothetical protein [Cellulomonas sp. S1-8]|uniref:hypothetical protein n=1 Tax=Cellulomonas sp. S1-8 TaxID=2904790 RepID=UPI002243BE1D|nr:hypothetical protein [Cellulomonas sp. S1-8]UZN03304.1 hypothetical protein OKX07_20005 [Cellulomonas sp. S1-8]